MEDTLVLEGRNIINFFIKFGPKGPIQNFRLVEVPDKKTRTAGCRAGEVSQTIYWKSKREPPEKPTNN